MLNYYEKWGKMLRNEEFYQNILKVDEFGWMPPQQGGERPILSDDIHRYVTIWDDIRLLCSGFRYDFWDVFNQSINQYIFRKIIVICCIFLSFQWWSNRICC